MRIAFYAPLKPPSHPVPSGDRRLARLLIDALGHGGHEVELAAVFRSREGAGDAARQDRLQHLGEKLAARLIRRYRARPPAARPALWSGSVYYGRIADVFIRWRLSAFLVPALIDTAPIYPLHPDALCELS